MKIEKEEIKYIKICLEMINMTIEIVIGIIAWILSFLIVIVLATNKKFKAFLREEFPEDENIEI